jgi:hypothetical protein
LINRVQVHIDHCLLLQPGARGADRGRIRFKCGKSCVVPAKPEVSALPLLAVHLSSPGSENVGISARTGGSNRYDLANMVSQFIRGLPEERFVIPLTYP